MKTPDHETCQRIVLETHGREDALTFFPQYGLIGTPHDIRHVLQLSLPTFLEDSKNISLLFDDEGRSWVETRISGQTETEADQIPNIHLWNKAIGTNPHHEGNRGPRSHHVKRLNVSDYVHGRYPELRPPHNEGLRQQSGNSETGDERPSNKENGLSVKANENVSEADIIFSRDRSFEIRVHNVTVSGKRTWRLETVLRTVSPSCRRDLARELRRIAESIDE